jgi:DNA polymerase-3 subunit epsilon
MAEPQLNRDCVFFDVETTGLHVLRDRILQIALIKMHKDGSPPSEFTALINPGIPIAEEAMQVHGITNDMVRSAPTFVQIAQKIFEFIGDADLAGYNCARFDIPMLMEEFARAGITFEVQNRRIIDVQRIFYKMEPRSLKAAYQFYCGKDLKDAHDALVDVRATIDVFKGQLDKYVGNSWVDEDGKEQPSPIQNDIQVIHDFTNDLRFADATQKIRVDEKGILIFNFGKYNGKTVKEVFQIEPSYYKWILEKEFSSQVKQIVTKEFESLKK